MHLRLEAVFCLVIIVKSFIMSGGVYIRLFGGIDGKSFNSVSENHGLF